MVFLFYETRSSSSCSQNDVFGSYPKQPQSIPHVHTVRQCLVSCGYVLRVSLLVYTACLDHRILWFNLLKPNDIYICRTAALTSRRYILNIYSTNIHTEYFKHAA